MQEINERVRQFRDVITTFIDERRDAKLKTTEGEKVNETAAKYEYSVWLADAARRAPQIQAVTHVLKATHPDARGSSLYFNSKKLQGREEIGTHSLHKPTDDVVGNAAALDVYKFLKLEVAGRQLLDWLQADDDDLLAALHVDAATAKEWALAFKGLIRRSDDLVSHPMAKQLYWCISGEPSDDADYHMLQPLFSSSLAHVVHQEIQDARFGEVNKEARKAKRDNKAQGEAYREYRGLAARKLGGTKPQNISQLNSERGGVNYLLASLPPSWNQSIPRNFLFTNTALKHFRSYEGVNNLLNELLTLLKSDSDAVMETRIKRERIEKALGQALAAFGLAASEGLQSGWSRDESCKLPLCEQLWLDSERIELPVRESYVEVDQAFIDAYNQGDWPDEVAHRFGNWLNELLRKHDLPVGDAEHSHWARQAIIEVQWPVPMQRSAMKDNEQEVEHG